MSAATTGRPVMYGDAKRWLLLHADSLKLLPELPANSVEAIITDPPYGIGFGGEAWDGGKLTDPVTFQGWTSGVGGRGAAGTQTGRVAGGVRYAAHRPPAGRRGGGRRVRGS